MRVAEHTPDEQTFQRASEWVARLEAADCTGAERDAFEDWLAEHPDHVHAWAQAETLHQQAALLADDAGLHTHVAAHARPARRRWLPRLAIAAGLCVAVIGGGLFAIDGNPATHHYANDSRVPQQRTLEDGSIATLDAGAALAARVGWRGRRIDLDRGRVQLQVAPSAKTLRVHAGNSTLRDIGTTFQVERRGDGRVDVALLEGAVEVTSSGAQASRYLLQPGQQVQVLPSGRIQPTAALSRPAAEGWLHGQLVFDGAPLQEVVERMNRYSATPLVVNDPALASLAVSGTFRAGDAQHLLRALALGWSIAARQRADGAVELHRQP